MREALFYRRGPWAPRGSLPNVTVTQPAQGRSRFKPRRSGPTLAALTLGVLTPEPGGFHRQAVGSGISPALTGRRRALLGHDEGHCAWRLWWVRARREGPGAGREMDLRRTAIPWRDNRCQELGTPQTSVDPRQARLLESLGEWPLKHTWPRPFTQVPFHM